MASIPGARSAEYSGTTEAKRAPLRLVVAALVQMKESHVHDGTGGLDEDAGCCCHRLARLISIFALLPLLLDEICWCDKCRNGRNWKADVKVNEPAASRAIAAATSLGMVGAFVVHVHVECSGEWRRCKEARYGVSMLWRLYF